MSFYFNIASQQQITFQQLNTELNIPDLKFSNSESNSDEVILGTKVFILHKSTRGISLNHHEGDYSIGINVIASEEDFRLAIAISKVIARLTNALILPEDSEEKMNVEQLTEQFDQSWIDMMKTSAVSLFLDKIGNHAHVLSIGCCYMNYTIGPDIHSKLDTSSETAYYHSLVSHIQKTQFFDRSKYAIPSIISATNPETNVKKRILVFYPQGNQLLSRADLVTFPSGEGRYEIPYQMLKRIANQKFTLIDEEQYLVDSLNEQEYQSIIQSIETILDEKGDQELRQEYSNYSKSELDDEFYRVAGVPDARLKIFALRRMANLIAEYEQRGIAMPNQAGNSSAGKPSPKQSPTIAKQTASPKPNVKKEISKVEPKKKWWKFW